MMNKLLNRDRLIWILTALLYLALAVVVTVFSGPLSWDMRAVSDVGAGPASIHLGVIVGVLLAGGLFAGLAVARPESSFIPRIAPLFGVAAAVYGFIVVEPGWYGSFALAPAAIGGVGLLARRQAQAYAKKFEEGNEADRPDTVDPARLAKGGEPDRLLSVGGAILMVGAGILLSVASAVVSPLMKPDLPAELQADGQVVTGEGNPVDVKILYGINYPTTTAMLGADEGVLTRLVNDGKVELTSQGVSLREDTALAVPVRAAEACAAEQGGPESAFDFTSRYYQEFFASDGTDDVVDLIAKAGKPLGDDFTSCTQSGKYEYAAGHALEESAEIAEQGFPQIYINGEEVKPETVDELEKLINEAA